MHYVKMSGGLGNQMFIYAFCIELRQLGFRTILITTKSKKSKSFGSNGYELDRIFQIQSTLGLQSKLFSILISIYGNIIRIAPHKYKDFLFKIIGISTIRVKENFIFYPEVLSCRYSNQLFIGTWQSEKYFMHSKELVRQQFVFVEKFLSEKTKILINDIIESKSVSIHVRRGDYLNEKFINGFGEICTLDYYRKAVAFFLRKNQSLKFFVFTDDQEWVEENFKEFNPYFVNHNIGSDSWQDMYLMSQCKHNIIANSSFSWWGAWLNANAEKIVIAPKLWWNGIEHDDVVPKTWIRV